MSKKIRIYLVLMLAVTMVLTIAGGCKQKETPPAKEAVPTPAPAPASSPAPAPQEQPKPEPPKPKPEKFVLGVSFIGRDSTAIWIANDRGYFADEGLDFEQLVFQGGGQAARAALAGQVHLASEGPAPVLALVNGADMKLIGALSDAVPFYLIAGKDIKTPEQLKGKRLAIARFGDLTEFTAITLLKKVGLDAKKDVTLTMVGGKGERFAAVESGASAATVIDPPYNIQAEELGLNVLASMDEVKWATSAQFVRTDAIAKYRDRYIKYLRAVIKAMHFMRDPKNKDEVIKIMAKNLKMDAQKDRKGLEAAYDAIVPHTPEVPFVPIIGLENILRFHGLAVPEALNKISTAENFIDSTLLRDILDSGYLEELKSAKY